MNDDDNLSDDDQLLELLAHQGPGVYKQVASQHDFINNKSAMLSVLEDFSRASLPWIERFDVSVLPVQAKDDDEVIDDSDLIKFDVNNDIQLDSFLMRLSQAAVLQVIPLLHELHLMTTKRPKDYIAEMVKTDDHMSRIKGALLAKAKLQETRNKVRTLRDMKKRGKQIQHEVQLEKMKKKKQFLEEVKKIRKSKDESGVTLDSICGEHFRGKKSKSATQSDDTRGKKSFVRTGGANKKRDFKNKKYGFGGQKKRSKMNTKESAHNLGRQDKVKASFNRFSKMNKLKKGNKGRFKAKRK